MELNVDKLPIIDKEMALKLAGNDQSLANDLLALLIKNLPADLAAIKQAYLNQDEKELRQQLHKLRGGVAYCGLPRMKAVLTEFENEFEDADRHNLPKLLERLDAEVQALLSAPRSQR